MSAGIFWRGPLAAALLLGIGRLHRQTAMETARPAT